MNIKYVKIILRDSNKVLQHYFIDAKKWDFPSGRVEENETETVAAKRELLERTGYDVQENKFVFKGVIVEDGEEFYLFEISIDYAVKVAYPGEKGGYKTEIRWVKEENKNT